MEYGKRHPVSLKKGNLMALGMLLAGGSFFLSALWSLFMRLTELDLGNGILLAINLFIDLLFILGMLLASLQIPSILLRILSLSMGSLISLLYLLNTLNVL